MLFVISTFENGKLSHICGISTFTYCPSIKSEISDFTVQIYFVNFPVYWVCLAIVWLGKLILEKIFIFIRTHYICCAFHTLLNKFTIGKWLRFFFFFFSNHITVCLSFNFLEKILRWQICFQFCYFLFKNHSLTCITFGNISTDNVFSNCDLWKLTLFPYELSIVLYNVLTKNYLSVHCSLNTLP